MSQRTTGHGISAGVAKVGAFLGVFLFPIITKALGLAGVMTLVAGFSALGFGLTLLLPEPARRPIEEVSIEEELISAAEAIIGGAAPSGTGVTP